jgi:ABC-2 type transport system permease protein
MSDLPLTWSEFGYERKTFWRSPMTVFAIVALPLLELFILVTSFGNDTIRVTGQPGTFRESTYLVATIVSVAIISATFFNVTTALSQERETGVLKRLRAAPLPTRVFIAARVGNAIVASFLLTLLLIALGRLVYGVPIPGVRMPALILALVVGSFAFCCIAFAFTLASRNAGALASLAMGTMLLLFFISGNFFNATNHTMVTVARIFPVKHLNQAMLIAFNPHTSGSGIAWSDLAVIAAWGIGALLLSIRYFRWAPSTH